MIPSDRDLPHGRLAARKTHLVSEVGDWNANRRRRRHRRALVLVPAVLALFVVTGFTAYVLTRDVSHYETVGCYDRASLDGNITVLEAGGGHPAEICAEMWRTGTFGGQEGSAPPQLAACVLETGAVGVFPGGSETCAELGLADLPASYVEKARGFAGLRDAIVAKLGEPASGSSEGNLKCLGESEARMVVRRELDIRGFSDWDIASEPEFTEERPCATVAFDHERKVVVLVPVWDD